MVLSCGFALVQAQESQKKREKTVIFTILGVLRKKLQAETMRRLYPRAILKYPLINADYD
jgi:hypothetical protein